MSSVSCGCTVQQPVCELGHSLFSILSLWYEKVDALDFPAHSLQERDAILTCFRNALKVYLSHCGYSVEKVSDETKHY